MFRLLTFTTLYPNRCQPTHGVFVENRLRALLASGQASAHVVAPVPYFPFASPLFGRYGRFARVPARETRHGLCVDHPRYLVVPKVGMAWSPGLLLPAARRHLQRLSAAGHEFDLIDAHYLYPDGVSAVRLARECNLPVVLTARGSDVTQIAEMPGPRRQILEAARGADAVIAVSQSLKEALIRLGVDATRITVLRNGVDLERFRPLDREAARRRFGFNAPTIASVGHLIARKRHEIVIEALASLPDLELAIAGEGPERRRLEALARRQGVAGKVRFLGAVDPAEMPALFNAAELTVLASSREGMANVLLESIACGTPVVATDVGGSGEVIAEPAAGILVGEASAAALAAAIRSLLDAPPARERTRAYAERFGWAETTAGQLTLFRKIMQNFAQRCHQN